MDGLRVLVTRDENSSEHFATDLQSLGAVPYVSPAIEIAFLIPPGLDDALLHLEDFDWIVLTSPNAVRAIGNRIEHHELDPGQFLGRTRIAVVGEATAESVANLGGKADIIAGTGHADGLASDLIAAGIDGCRLLFPASRIARAELPRRLRDAGASVLQLAIYDTMAPELIIVPDAGSLDVATFTSPSAVWNIRAVMDEGWFESVPAVCIGSTTGRAAQEAGAVDVFTAPEPSMDGIITALLEFQQRRQQEV